MTVLELNRAGGPSGRRKIAVIGSGISGASAAWALQPVHDVTLFEADDRAGGHTATVEVDYDGRIIPVDTGFIVYNTHNYPELTRLFALLGVETHETTMSFALSLDRGRREWSGQTFRSLFAQKRNVFSPSFLWMLREILRFNRQCLLDRESGLLAGITIGEYLETRKFSPSFRDDYLIPMAAAIWSTPRIRMMDFPAATFVTFFENHRLIHHQRPAWRTVTGGARTYLDRLLAPLDGHVRLSTPVRRIGRIAGGVLLHLADGSTERFDEVIVATHSDQALAMLGEPTAVEQRILSSVTYRPNRVVLHRDERLMPRRRQAWAAWNYLRHSDGSTDGEVCVTYWMNRLQGIDAAAPLFVSLNPVDEPRRDLVFGEYSYAHPQFDARALSAQAQLDDIQGHHHIRYAGAWTGHGFHEDGLRSGLNAAQALGARIPWRPEIEHDRPPAIAAE